MMLRRFSEICPIYSVNKDKRKAKTEDFKTFSLTAIVFPVTTQVYHDLTEDELLMVRPEKILAEMEDLLNRLIESAKTLLELSKHAVEEDELIRLQQDQEVLLAKLIQKDEEFQKLPGKSQEQVMPRRLKIDQKIDDFQTINAEFVENISAVQQRQFNHQKGPLPLP